MFQDDWVHKQDIVKSIILNKLGKNKRIYGRKCVIKVVNNNDKNLFLNENHLQGQCISKVNLGLYYNNELVSLMTFGKRSISKNMVRHELLRFCNKLNTTVIGGASKLFKYFINNYKYKELYSFADYGRSNGNMYEKLGFKFLNKSDINYWWVVDGIKSHRYNWNKTQLAKKKMLKTPEETEDNCMHRHNYFKIYDCGTLNYVYNK